MLETQQTQLQTHYFFPLQNLRHYIKRENYIAITHSTLPNKYYPVKQMC